jgi:hypothetical protein
MSKQVHPLVGLAKQIGFPYSNINTMGFDNSFHWRKRHGHAGSNMIYRCVEKAVKAGFVRLTASLGGTPDGSYTSSGTTYTKTVNGVVVATLVTHSNYGVTSYENSFSMTLTGAKTT